MTMEKFTTFLASFKVLTFASVVNLPVSTIIFGFNDEKKVCKRKNGKKESRQRSGSVLAGHQIACGIIGGSFRGKPFMPNDLVEGRNR
jgi:hypothetical protein